MRAPIAIAALAIACRTAAPAPPNNIAGAAPVPRLPIVESTSGTVTYEPARTHPFDTKLIERARAALARGDLVVARNALDDHASQFMGGPDFDEVIALYIEISIRAGDRTLAKQLAEHFIATYPTSRFLFRVRGMAAIF